MLTVIIALLVSTPALAQIDTSIYNNVGRTNQGGGFQPMHPYQMQIRQPEPVRPPSGPTTYETYQSGDQLNTTVTDQQGNRSNCRTYRSGELTRTICN